MLLKNAVPQAEIEKALKAVKMPLHHKQPQRMPARSQPPPPPKPSAPIKPVIDADQQELIRQVLALTPPQIAALPAEQQRDVLALV